MVSTAEVRGTRPTTSAEYIVKEIERHKAGAGLIFVVVAAAVAGGAYGLYKFVGHKPATSLQSIKISKLTNSGRVGTGREGKFASISPDGKYVAYSARDESWQSSLWVRHVATTSNVQIVPPAGVDVEFAAPAFSPTATTFATPGRRRTARPHSTECPCWGHVKKTAGRYDGRPRQILSRWETAHVHSQP
jgi:hypothetical protein